MSDLRTINVRPIYGWGWVISGERRFQVPEPFVMSLERADDKRWTGIVLTEAHEFEGRRVTLTRRHIHWTGDVNIVVEPDEPGGKAASGFGMLTVPHCKM